jgi:hypothetical protein
MVVNSGSLGAGRSCTVSVTFTPSARGLRTAQLAVTSDGGDPTSALSGTGTEPLLTVSPTSGAFGPVPVNTTSTAQTFTVTNRGQAQADLSLIQVTGPNAAEFSKDDRDCTVNAGNRLDPGRSCDISVTFTPRAQGLRTAKLVITGDLGGNPTVPLSGTGTVPSLAITPTLTPNFGGVEISSTSPARNYNITNTGGAEATLSSVDVVGADARDFSVDDSDCMTVHGGRLAPGATCVAAVTFSPSASGTRSAQLIAIGVNTNNPTEDLIGYGAGPGDAAISVDPSEGGFGTVPVGQPGTPLIVFVTNGGGAPATITGFQIDGADSSSYSIDDSNCRDHAGGTLQGNGDRCHVTVNFTPRHAGQLPARITVKTTGGGTPTVALTGAGD